MKTEGDVLVILAKHETQTETGGSFVSKQFEQRFSLPSGVKPESIISALGRDGTLKVTAPRTSSQQANLSFKKTRGSLEEEVPNRAETTQNPANQGLYIFFCNFVHFLIQFCPFFDFVLFLQFFNLVHFFFNIVQIFYFVHFVTFFNLIQFFNPIHFFNFVHFFKFVLPFRFTPP